MAQIEIPESVRKETTKCLNDFRCLKVVPDSSPGTGSRQKLELPPVTISKRPRASAQLHPLERASRTRPTWPIIYLVVHDARRIRGA